MALLIQLTYSVELPKETKYDENKRNDWAKLIELDPFTGSIAILITNLEKQIGTSKLVLKNSFSTMLLLLC